LLVRIGRVVLLFLLLIVVAVAGALAWAMRHPEIAAIARPDPASFDAELVSRGEMLAGIGNCGVCHTRQGGGRYAGGLALPTPFGTLYTTNITPDPETGIGAWSEAAFLRAMRQGVDREGRHLYPAFPYDYFATATDEDLRAIYAYLMTREPVSAAPQANALPFPFNIRLLMAGWNLLFLRSEVFEPDPDRDAEWNRGAYIVEGLGHCGACHSPRNILGAAVKTGPRAYGGGAAEGWYVPPLNADTPAPVPWTQIAIVNYLIDGWDEDHGIAAGPMRPVTDDLYEQSEDDVFAIAAYVMSLKGDARPEEEQNALAEAARSFANVVEWGGLETPPVPDDPVMQQGAAVFEAQCATCHRSGGLPAPLALSTVVNAPDPDNLIRIVFFGINPPPMGSLDRSMPGRAIQISDDEMAALAAFVRERYSERPAWEGIAEAVSDIRAEVP
jgi:mono/diheme cytochrome c family protein